MNRIEFFGRKSYRSCVVELNEYKKAALKRAQVKLLGADEGYSARIPGFAGLIVFGQTKREALAELESALDGWIELSLSRAMVFLRCIGS